MSCRRSRICLKIWAKSEAFIGITIKVDSKIVCYPMGTPKRKSKFSGLRFRLRRLVAYRLASIIDAMEGCQNHSPPSG